MVQVRRVFTGGNTSSGFYSLHNNIISEDRKKLYIIKGMPGGGKSSLMREIGGRLKDKGFDLEYHHCPSDPYSIDALVVNKLKLAILDGTPPHGMDSKYPGLKDTIVDLEKFIDPKRLIGSEEKIVKAKRDNSYAYMGAFKSFKASKSILEIIEEDNSRYVDKIKLNRIISELIDDIFSNQELDYEDNGFTRRNLFSSAYSPEGYIDYTATVLDNIKNIYYIKGEPGLGQDKILQAIIELSDLKNYSIEIFFNSLIPDRPESIYIKNLNTIISLNNISLKYENKTINLNEKLGHKKIQNYNYDIFNQLVSKGIGYLEEAKKNHLILEKTYRPAINYLGIDEIREEIYNEILGYI